jgi:hypothetical protein
MNKQMDRVLVAILLDASASMEKSDEFQKLSRFEKSYNFIVSFIRKLHLRSIHEGKGIPEYLIGVYFYNRKIVDSLNGFKNIKTLQGDTAAFAKPIYRGDYDANIWMVFDYVIARIKFQKQLTDWTSCIICNISDGFPESASPLEIKDKLKELGDVNNPVRLINILASLPNFSQFEEYHLRFDYINSLSSTYPEIYRLIDLSSYVPDKRILDFTDRRFLNYKLIFGYDELDTVMEFIP